MQHSVYGKCFCPKCGKPVELLGFFHTVSSCNGRVTVTDLTTVSGPHECEAKGDS